MNDSGPYEIARTVYSSVEAEFYAWKAKYIADIFGRVFKSSATPVMESFQLDPDPFDTLPPNRKFGGDYIYSWDYDDDGEIIQGSDKRIPIIVVEPDYFEPHVRYQFCTPSSRNITARAHDMLSAPFVPYPEDPTFDRNEYLKLFESFQWEDYQYDPDDEVIQYETVRRLHMEHGFSSETIDDIISLFPLFHELRLLNESGLLWEVSQRQEVVISVSQLFLPDPHRDLPDVIWGDGRPSSSKPQLPLHFAQESPTPDDIFTQINRGLAKFCPNLNCITPCCQVHVGRNSDYTPALTPRTPRLTSDDFFEEPGAACGADCFRYLNSDGVNTDILQHKFTFLHGMLKLDPDVLPCDLAVICNLPCFQTFLYRSHTISDSEVWYPEREAGPADFSGNELPTSPCVHSGPCSARMNCECFRMKVFCERNCRCDTSCSRRWKGCNSTCGKTKKGKIKKGKTKGLKCSDPDVCDCRRWERECDPELCTKCDARDQNVHFPPEKRRGRARPSKAARCHNVDIQRGQFKRFNINRSKHGLGAFAAQNIAKGEPIGEYIGELVGEGANHMAEIQKHSRLNYVFGIKHAPVVIDAQWVGNPTRFLNDSVYVPAGSRSKSTPPNCAARESIVNGEKRLVLIAEKKIKKGAELFLDYGPKYWELFEDEV